MLVPFAILDELSEALVDTLADYNNIIILGDFNIHVDEPNNAIALELIDIMSALGLKQVVDFPTHNMLHTLDLIFIEAGPLEDTIRCYPGAFISDHRIVNLAIQQIRPSHPVKEVIFRKYKNINYDLFKQDLSEACASLMLNKITDLETTVNRVLDKHAPEKRIKVKLRNKLGWFTEDIRDQCKVV